MFTTLLASIGILTGLGGLVLGRYALTRARAADNASRAMSDRAAAVSASGADPRAVRDVAVLHYDALEEMSGARSFSLAMLNRQGDGVVITSINGRTESRTYAKAVVRGAAETLLSPEEYRVIRSARLGEGFGAQVPSAPGGDGGDGTTGGVSDEEGGQRVTVFPEGEDAEGADASHDGGDTPRGDASLEGEDATGAAKGPSGTAGPHGAKRGKRTGNPKGSPKTGAVTGPGHHTGARATAGPGRDADTGEGREAGSRPPT